MPDEFEQEQVSSAASTQAGGTPEPSEDNLEDPDLVAQPEDVVDGGGGEETPEPDYTAPPRPTFTSPYAGTQQTEGGLFSENLKSNLALYLPEEVVAQMDAEMRGYADKTAKSEAQKFVQAFEQQQVAAQELGVPAEYMNDVKRYSNVIPEEFRGTPNGAYLSIMYGIHQRVAAGETDFNTEMKKYVEKTNPAPPPPKPRAQPLAPSARTAPSPVSGRAVVPVGGNGAATDPLLAHFPEAKKLF